MIELQGRKALISGAAQGLGRAIAGLFVERGAQVMLADIDEAGAAKAADELGPMARSVRCDVTEGCRLGRAPSRPPPPPSAASTRWSTTPASRSSSRCSSRPRKRSAGS